MKRMCELIKFLSVKMLLTYECALKKLWEYNQSILNKNEWYWTHAALAQLPGTVGALLVLNI